MKLDMFKTVFIGSVMTIAGAALPVSAAQLHVTVPFSFSVAGTTLPAGEYNVSESDNGILTLSGYKGSAMVMTTPSDYSRNALTGLDFVTGADKTRVLTGIQISGALGREIPVRSEKVVLTTSQK